MASMHDVLNILGFTGAQKPPHLITLLDDARDLRYVSGDLLLEPANGHISKSIKGDGTTLTFTIGKIPANCIVKTVTFSITTGAASNTITIAFGIAGTTGKYMTATSFTNSMDTAGVKTVTTLPIHETTARTVIATFVGAPEAAFRGTVVVHYIKVPAPLA